MFGNLTDREKKMVYVLISLAFIFVFYKFIWIKQADFYSKAKADLETTNMKYINNKHIVEKLPALREENKLLKEKLSKAGEPFKLDILGGEQVSKIGQLFENAGLKVLSAVTSPVKDDKEYYSQNINFKIQGSYGAMEQFLYDTENSPYSLVVTKCNMYPEKSEDKNPIMSGLNYTKLIADVIMTIHGDKNARVTQATYINSSKIDLFKPTEEDLSKMQELQKSTEQENVQTPETQVVQSPSITHVSNQYYEQNQPSINQTETNTNTNTVPNNNMPKANTNSKKDSIIYDFEKR